MQQLQLNEEDLSQTTRRAFELATIGQDATTLEKKFADYIRATEELGIPRDAVLQALREQLNVHDMEVESGQRVFAPSDDGHWYAATVTSVNGEQTTVRFDSGGARSCEKMSLRPFSLAPGLVVHACHKGDDSWWAARIRSYNPEKDKVEVVYRLDGTTETLPLKRIRLFAEKPNTTRSSFSWVPNPMLDLALKLSTGGILGYALHYLIR